MKTLFILLLSCFPCLAQFGVEQPMFAMLSTSPQSITNNGAVAYYWNFMDLASNAVVNGWTDRVQQATALAKTPTAGPTNTADGVLFSVNNNTHILTNAPLANQNANCVIAFILHPLQQFSSYASFLGGAGAQDWWAYEGAGHPNSLWTLGGVTPLSSAYDKSKRQMLAAVVTATTLSAYTNGVLSKTISGGMFNINSIGTYQDHASANFFSGTINEFIIWTNISDGLAIVTNYWIYATNYYNEWAP